MKESAVAKRILLHVTRMGGRLGRNNIGVATYPNGSVVRYGLFGRGAADYIGLLPVTVTPDMVGRRLGVFIAIETKRTRGGRVTAEQKQFMEFVRGHGGIAAIATHAEEVDAAIKEALS